MSLYWGAMGCQPSSTRPDGGARNAYEPWMQELRDDDQDALGAGLARVRAAVAAAAAASGRRAEDVTLVAVTKSVGPREIEALLALGVDAIGESRPERIAELDLVLGPGRVPWHLVGHYQRKKVGKTLPLLRMVHSVHGLDLMQRIDTKARELDLPPVPCLLQINVAGEGAKQGFSPRDALDALDVAAAMPRLFPRGLMTMTPKEASLDERRRMFAELRELRDRAGSERFPELSMGMSEDFLEAIAEGATMVRVGSALFDGAARSR